jgi:hypothetical protein
MNPLVAQKRMQDFCVIAVPFWYIAPLRVGENCWSV